VSVLVVAGTDTGVGKTVVTAALAALAHADGGLKPSHRSGDGTPSLAGLQ